MTPHEKERLVEIVTGLAELTGRSLSPIAVAIFVGALEDLPFQGVSLALSRIAQESRYFPSPAEVRERCGQGAVSVEDRANAEAGKVFEAVRNVGGYRSVVFDDPVTMAVITSGFGGWVALTRDLVDSERKWFMIEFAKLYRAYHACGMQRGGVLAGIIEQTNTANGYPTREPPVFVGDRERCLIVMDQDPRRSKAEPVELLCQLEKLMFAPTTTTEVEG
jgi:hypothetical protein